MKLLRLCCLFILLILAGWCCKKKYVDVIQVMEKTSDLSIQGMGDVTICQMLSESALLVSDGKQAFTSKNSGSVWIKMNLPATSDSIVNIQFTQVDLSTGYILTYNKNIGINTLYTTTNGGSNWKNFGAVDFVFCHNSAIHYIKADFFEIEIYKSADYGNSFQFYKTISSGLLSGPEFGFFYENGKVIVANISNTIQLIGVDPDTEDMNSFYFSRLPNATHFFNNKYYFLDGISVASETLDLFGDGIPYRFDKDFTLNDLDHFGDFAVIVGENSVYTNQQIQTDESWNDVYDEKGSSFPHHFSTVNLFNKNQGYITGENGLIWKVKFYY